MFFFSHNVLLQTLAKCAWITLLLYAINIITRLKTSLIFLHCRSVKRHYLVFILYFIVVCHIFIILCFYFLLFYCDAFCALNDDDDDDDRTEIRLESSKLFYRPALQASPATVVLATVSERSCL